MQRLCRWYPIIALISGIAMLCAAALGHAQSVPTGLQWDVESVDFGIQPAGVPSEVRTVTLTNSTTQPSTSSPIWVAEAPQFVLVGHTCPAELAAGAVPLALPAPHAHVRKRFDFDGGGAR